MTTPVFSAAAGALLRGLFAKSGASRSDILLTEVRSVDWRSLTFDGERHEIAMRFIGPNARAEAARAIDNIEDHEFSIGRVIVADINVVGHCISLSDGSVSIAIEALTIAGD